MTDEPTPQEQSDEPSNDQAEPAEAAPDKPTLDELDGYFERSLSGAQRGSKKR